MAVEEVISTSEGHYVRCDCMAGEEGISTSEGHYVRCVKGKYQPGEGM